MTQWPFKTLNRQLVEQLYDDYHEGVFILDSEGRFVYYNKAMAQMDGQPHHDATGQRFVDLYELNVQNSVSLACLAKQAPIKDRCVYYRTSFGTLVNAYCNSYPFFEDGKLAGAVCFSMDINLANAALDNLARNYMSHPETHKKNGDLVPEAPHTFASLLGHSEAFLKAVEKAKEAAIHNMPIMLVGETGSGKELFAQSIHNHRAGRSRRFLAVNCPAIPENLLESLLFGTTKGSFTGAMDKAGLFEAAGSGTIFLDEINSMSMDLQSKLLRVLQEKKVSRVGSTREVKVHCQIISATSHNPYAEISAHRLRQDLFYRLSTILVYIPPLRDRLEDIGPLSDHFIKKYRSQVKSRTQGLEPETLRWLQRKLWPGNVRELEHAVASAMVFAKNETMLKIENFNTSDQELIPSPMIDQAPQRQSHQTLSREELESHSDWELPVKYADAKQRQALEEKERIEKTLEKTGGHKAAAAAILGISPQLLNSKLKKYGLTKSPPVDELEKQRIMKALEKTGGHKSAAALLLGLSRQLLYQRMKKYGLS